MKPNDFDAFSETLDSVCMLLSRGAYRPNAASTALFFHVLADHPLPVVRKALEAHIADPQRGRFVPVPADVLAQIAASAQDDGRPSVEEAWAQMPFDEAQSVVWTAEMAEAFGICLPLLCEGDKVAARMAFKAAYTRLVDEARSAWLPVAWSPSLGHDARSRHDALRVAVEKGRMALEHARQIAVELLPADERMPELLANAVRQIAVRH